MDMKLIIMTRWHPKFENQIHVDGMGNSQTPATINHGPEKCQNGTFTGYVRPSRSTFSTIRIDAIPERAKNNSFNKFNNKIL